ncbi:MAG: putative MetA-pathway of phenol degradation [Algoriphagus marincola HL-49]|uniref:Putative MetA-pathway of phenol degradation n=1 Tax=Algoriphagus marincola HL-49 TaxID=1305737 RepID=A0A0P7XP82_9BACT|nr:MAG: putative MetA-pathway of phenol degradation [Algoriphagus marincola HL-49]
MACTLGLCVPFIYSQAQSPIDELLMPKNEICFLLNYEYGQFDQYWEGDFLRENQTIATVQRRTAMVMAAYGISDRLDAYLGLPYVSTNSTIPNGGKFAGASGIQDVSVGLKYKAYESTLGKGRLSLFGSLLFSTPASNYLSDYQPYSLGLGSPQLAWRATGHYEFDQGFYSRLVIGYIWRGYTEAEREYYYNDGSFFTPWMDVPSSWNIDLTVGKWFLERSLRFEISYSNQNATSGDDIRAYNAPQPTNQVDFSRLGAFAQYYFSQVKGLGVLASINQVVSGRNAPKMTSFGVGITYQFSLKAK